MVEGDLADLPLASLLAVLAHERSTVVLRVQRGVEQGALYLENGELVHAAAGRAIGDQAVRHLLQHAGGRFRLVREPIDQPQTVTRPLAEFLHHRGSGAANSAAEADAAAGDRSLFAEMLELLTRLEQDRARLAEGRVDGGADAALVALAGIVNQLIAFVLARHRDAAAQPVQVLARMAAAQPYAQLFGEEHGRLTIDAVLAALDGEPDATDERRRTLVAIAAALVDVLAEYAALAAALFHASAERDQWRITSDVFIEDLRSAVQQLDSQDKGDGHGQEVRARGR
jgi:uncharacterized protein DUF4388